MENAYISSTIYALRAKGSLSFCFNDSNSYYLLTDRVDRYRNHSSLSRCCSCCGVSNHKVSINKSYLYGPRQSSLLQWSAYRKLILGGGDRNSNYYYYKCYSCSPSYGLERACCGVSSCVNERVACSNSRRISRVNCCCCVVDGGDSRVCGPVHVDDTEALLSLLSEEVDEEGYCAGGGKRRDWGLYKNVEVKGRERNSGLYERVSQVKKETSGEVCECGKKKKKGEQRLVDDDGNRWSESVRIESGEDDLRRSGKERRGAILRGENRRIRKESSEGSSYYSLSSSGDYDDESQVHDKHTLLAEETLSGRESSRVKREGRYIEEIDKHGKVSAQQNNTLVGGAEWDLRNNLEKKRMDRAFEDVQHSGRESSQRRTRVSGLHESNHEKISSSQRPFNDTKETATSISNLEKKRTDRVFEEVQQSERETSQRRTRVSGLYESNHEKISKSHSQLNDTKETSTSATNLDRRTRKQYSQSEDEVGETSTSRRNIAEDKQEIQRNDVKRTSQSQIRLDSTEENLEIAKDERHKAVSCTTEQENIKRSTQQVQRISEVQDHNSQSTSISQSRAEIGVTGMELNRDDVSSPHQVREQSLIRTSQQDVQKANARRNSQQAARLSKIHNTNIEETSIRQSQASISNQVNNTNLISISYQGPTESHPQTGERLPQRTQFERGSYNVDNTAVVRASKTERIIDSQVTSETRVHQETEAISVGMLVGNSRTGNNRTTESHQPIRRRKELEEASTSQEPLRLVYQPLVQKDDVEEGLRRSPQTTVIPPRSQSLSRSSVRAELESGFESQKVSNTTSESFSSSYTNSRRQPLALQEGSYEGTENTETPGEPMYLTAPEDSLGSADRLQQSSAQFFGEFVEKARLEASSSEIQRVEEVSEAKLSSDDENNRHKVSSQQTKDDKSSLSSVSESKGPSAEMWDVSDPIFLKTPKVEEPEAITPTTKNAIVKRSGRSLWNIIADIITLKWSSSSETSTSAARSRKQIPSNESVVSEAWFSTHESEHSRGKNSKSSRSESRSDQQQVMELSTPAHGTESDGFTDQTRYPEVEPSPSTTSVGSGSMSKRISLSGEENLGWTEDGRSSGSSPPRIESVESPSQLSLREGSSTIISSVSDSTKMKIGSVEQIEQYGPAKATEGSLAEGSSGVELKRRKLQRIKQVPKDRFDEWEEAFTIENEQRKLDEMFMREALLEAQKAADTWEVPVGAVLVQNGTIIARGYNLVEELRDSTAHAEMICIREASNQLRSWRLSDTTLYVTLEPCPMCAGAILQARISTLVWGATNKLLGADGSWIRLFPDGGDGVSNSDKPAPPVHPFHPNMNIRRGVLAMECAEVMQQFFQLRRKKKKEKEKEATVEESPSSRLAISHPSKMLKKMHDVFHIMFCL